MADNTFSDNSVAEERIIHELVPGESTPVSSASTPAVIPNCNSATEKPAVTKKASFAKIHLQSELPATIALNREKEEHKVRLQGLRKELNHIKATEWLYEPIETLIGRGNQ